MSRARAKSRIRDLAVERCPAVSPRLMASSAFLVPTTSSILESGNRAQKRVSHRCHMLSDGTLFSSQIHRCLVRTSAWSHSSTMDANEALPTCTLHSAFCTMPRGYTGNDLQRLLRFASPHVDERVSRSQTSILLHHHIPESGCASVRTQHDCVRRFALV